MTQIFNSKSVEKMGMILFAGLLLTGCEPTVRLEAPEKPVRIDLNVKIEHEVRVKIEKEVEQLIKKNPNIF